MNTNNNSGKIRPRTKLIGLCISIIFIVVGVIFGWQWTADRLEATLSQKIKEYSSQGQTMTCNNLDITGFPFRLGVNCSHTAFDDNTRRIGITAGELRTAAQIYRPGQVVAELDGPLLISNRSNQIKMTWENLKASASIDLSDINRTSMEASSVTIDFQNEFIAKLGHLLAENVQVHLRQNEGDLDVSTSAIKLIAQDANGKTIIPSSEFFMVAKLSDRADFLSHENYSREISLKGTDVQLEHFNFIAENGSKISASGPLSFSSSGLLSGELNLSIGNARALVDIAKQNSGEVAQRAEQIKALLFAFQSNSQDSINVKLTIRDGFAQMGLIPLGFIPAI